MHDWRWSNMADVLWTQLSLTGEDDKSAFTRDEVLAINPHHTRNGQRVADLAQLGYLPEPVLDPTYGYGSMWSEYTPQVLIGHDFDPAKDPGGESVDFTNLPYADNHFASCLYDPPYKHGGTPARTETGGFDEKYGTQVYRTKAEQIQLIFDGAVECGRVTSEYLIVKCQDQVVADCVSFQTSLIVDHLVADWSLKDRLHLLSYRPQPAGRSQKNARNNFSTFLVFRQAR